ncbi:LysE family translocator [Hydrogenophaga sp. NFH-34]|uniref:LysE family translocator n=1 Tax=Hydrogenophaga sp. NFH-34 TaxID=2744446 RepID=UPI001F3C5DF6|nr:LysE family translocator [Hydrogenophaga sp. NFH-34]
MNDSMLLFSTLALVTVATPGPTTLLALNHGARHGVGAALPGVGGAVLSDAVLIAAVAAGLGSLLATSAAAFELLRWTGVAYLAWLGWRLLHAQEAASAPHDEATAATRRERPAAVFRRSFTVAVTNPKGYLFFSALLPSFTNPNEPLGPQYTLLAVVFAGVDGAVLLGYALAGAAGARRFGAGAQRRIDQASGLALLVLAGGMALWRRDAP